MATSLSIEERSKMLTMLESHFQISAADSTSRFERNLVNEAHPILFVDVRILKELIKLTPLMSGCYSGLKSDGLARMLLIRHKEDFPQACRLAETGLCLPVSTASCERGFSLQNRIKIKSSTKLLPENLERLMKSASGPEIDCSPWGTQLIIGTGLAEGLYQPSKRKVRLTAHSESTVQNAIVVDEISPSA
jgi:hAT family C-terminal dimerisation region